jgi:hypothetical protein
MESPRSETWETITVVMPCVSSDGDVEGPGTHAGEAANHKRITAPSNDCQTTFAYLPAEVWQW